MILGDILSACPHRQFHTLPGLLDSRATLPNSYPNALRTRKWTSRDKGIPHERFVQFRPPIALRTDLSHITTELWEIPVLRMAH